MTSTAQSTLRLRKIVLVALLATLCVAVLVSVYQNRQWSIPEEAKLRKNPVGASLTALVAARSIYVDKCVQCHGQSGKGDGSDAALYYPAPARFNDTKRMDAVTDGELFYEISEGRKPMPSFKKRLSEEQRWQLVLLVRSFAAEPSNR